MTKRIRSRITHKLFGPHMTPSDYLHKARTGAWDEACDAAEALARAGEIDLLIELLSSERETTYNAAALALRGLADPRATEPLIRAIEKNKHACGTLLYALGAHELSAKHIPLLQTVAAESGWEAMQEAQEILSRFEPDDLAWFGSDTHAELARRVADTLQAGSYDAALDKLNAHFSELTSDEERAIYIRVMMRAQPKSPAAVLDRSIINWARQIGEDRRRELRIWTEIDVRKVLQLIKN